MATRCCRQSVLPQPAAGQSRWPEALPRRLVPDWRIASVRKCSQGCSDSFCCSWRVGWRGNKRAGMARPEPHSAWQRCRSESTGYRFRQPDTDRQWEMIRKSGFQRLVFQYFQGRRDQDMVDGALWLPAGEGLWSSIGKLKPGAGAELFEFMTLRAGIEVAHDDHIRVCRDQVGHVAKLLKSCAPAQSEVKNDHPQRLSIAAEFSLQRASAGDCAGQPVFVHTDGILPAKKPVAGMRDDADLAVGLVCPPRETGVRGQILGLVDEAGSETAAIDFLKTDDVVVCNKFRYRIEVGNALVVGQDLAPATGDVLAVLGGRGSSLDVEAQQLQHPLLAGTHNTRRAAGRDRLKNQPGLRPRVRAQSACRRPAAFLRTCRRGADRRDTCR